MISIDRAAIIWSIVIVIVAVEIAAFGNASELEHHEDKTMNRVFQKELEKQILMETSSIHLQTDRETYIQNDKIKISGFVSKKLLDTPITLVVINPNEDIITIAQLNVDNDRNFAETILIGGTLWEQEGRHVIKVHYGEKNTAETSFNFFAAYEGNIQSPAITEPLWKEYCATPAEIGIPDDPIPVKIIEYYVISTEIFHQLGGIEDSIQVNLPNAGIAVCPWFGGSQGIFNTVDDGYYSFEITFGATTKQFSYQIYPVLKGEPDDD